jgi:hypothetical protein
MAAGAIAGAAGKSGFLSGLGGLGGALSIGSSLIGAIGGLFQKAKGKKMLKQLQDPGYSIPKGYYKNLADYEQLARVGMPMEQYNLAKQGIDRTVSTGLRGLSRSSNPSAGVASAVRAGIEGGLNLEATNAGMRRQNILGAMGARRELAGQELAKQQYAQQRYMDKVNQANALMGAGQQNTAGSLGALGQFGMYNSLYGGRGGSSDAGSTQTNLPTGGISTGGFNAWQLPGAMGGSALPGNNFSGINTRLNTINPATGRPR